MKRYLFFIICIGLLFTSCGTKSEKEIEALIPQHYYKYNFLST